MSQQSTIVKIKPEDWKLCVLVYLHIEDMDEDRVSFENHLIRFFRPSDRQIENAYVAEVYTIKSKYDDIKSAFHGSLEVLNQYLDRVSLLTFKPCHIIQPVGISRYSVDIGEEFDLLIPEEISEDLPKLELKLSENEVLNKYISSRQLNDALREIRLGIESRSIFLKFTHFYNAIERIADLKSEEFVTRKCDSCGNVNQIGIKATANKMREFFIDEGFTKKEFNECRKIRGKLAHGSAERNQKLYRDIFKNIGKVESIAANLTSKYTGIKIIYGTIPRLADQFWLLRGEKLAEATENHPASYDIKQFKFEFSAVLNKVDDEHDYTDDDWQPLFNPIPTDLDSSVFKVYPYSWPY